MKRKLKPYLRPKTNIFQQAPKIMWELESDEFFINIKQKQSIKLNTSIQSYNLSEVQVIVFNMTTSHLTLKPLQITQELKHDHQKLANLENSLGDLTKEFINKDIDMIESESSKIKNFELGVNSALSKVKSYKEDCYHTVSQLEKQISDLESKIRIYERDFKNSNKENEYKKQIQANEKKYITEWQKRIQNASRINTQNLEKVDIDDRKSKAHEVFKWVIVTIYGEPESKYYWPNFKDQIFHRDEGQDFRERMGKVNASTARQEQKVKTIDFLKNYNEIIMCKELKKVQTQVEDIRKVAQSFLTCYDLAQNTRDLQKLIEKSRQQSRERDEEAMRWKAREDALKDRIKTNKQYSNVLNKIESYLVGKIEAYAEKQKTAEEVIQRLKESGTIGPLDIDIGDEKRDHCECRIF